MSVHNEFTLCELLSSCELSMLFTLKKANFLDEKFDLHKSNCSKQQKLQIVKSFNLLACTTDHAEDFKAYWTIIVKPAELNLAQNAIYKIGIVAKKLFHCCFSEQLRYVG